MSNGVKYLHSHSAIEREIKLPKHLVIVDVEYEDLFKNNAIKPFKFAGVEYIKVPTLAFVKNGGVFKNFIK